MEETMKFGRNKAALKSRREGALKRLTEQLELNHRPTRNGAEMMALGSVFLPLSDIDKKRIQKEIDILKSRI